jgi:antitoxin (DNA-binding transcriptional repressor) of toxin-antitoxin stability system
MRTMQVAEFKTRFSKVIELVKAGEKIVIAYGKRKDNVAIIIPYSEYKSTNAIKLGMLKGKGSYAFKKNFSMTSEELIGS